MIEKVLGSKGKVRILKVLSRKGAMNVTRIAKEVGLNYRATIKHLSELVEAGVIKEVKLGRLRIFMIDESNPLGRRIKDLFSYEPSS